jgi:hypothetical protein
MIISYDFYFFAVQIFYLNHIITVNKNPITWIMFLFSIKEKFDKNCVGADIKTPSFYNRGK